LLEVRTSELTAAADLLRLEAVRKYFPVRGAWPWSKARGYVRAVDGVSFALVARSTMGIVGETGCGKTTTGRLVLKLEDPTAGRVLFRGKDLAELKGRNLRHHRPNVQAVFQDPWSSLNPRMRAGDIVGEPLLENKNVPRSERRDRVNESLSAVGLELTDARKYPHEFSGGQRQRIAIARALVLRPALVVLDEPASSLDVSVRAQILNLLLDLQAEFDMAFLLIAHDLAAVRYLCDDVAVMYLGKIVEQASVSDLFSDALHPYTQALIAAGTPTRPGEESAGVVVGGEVPSPINPPSGCRFRTRCPFAFDRCSTEEPPLRELAPGRWAACHLY
jgi:oligopeptide/dipeptide ABC transporter ATP-binding protein